MVAHYLKEFFSKINWKVPKGLTPGIRYLAKSTINPQLKKKKSTHRSWKMNFTKDPKTGRHRVPSFVSHLIAKNGMVVKRILTQRGIRYLLPGHHKGFVSGNVVDYILSQPKGSKKIHLKKTAKRTPNTQKLTLQKWSTFTKPNLKNLDLSGPDDLAPKKQKIPRNLTLRALSGTTKFPKKNPQFIPAKRTKSQKIAEIDELFGDNQ